MTYAIEGGILVNSAFNTQIAITQGEEPSNMTHTWSHGENNSTKAGDC